MISDDDMMAAMCLTEKRNLFASRVGESGFDWEAAVGGTAGVGTRSRDDKASHVGSADSAPDGRSPGAHPALPAAAAAATPLIRGLHQVEQLLQSYEREMSSVESSLREMQENLSTTRWASRREADWATEWRISERG